MISSFAWSDIRMGIIGKIGIPRESSKVMIGCPSDPYRDSKMEMIGIPMKGFQHGNDRENDVP